MATVDARGETRIIAVVDGRRSVHDFVIETLRGAEYAVRGFQSRATFLVEFTNMRPVAVLLGADDDAFDVDTPLAVRMLRGAPDAVPLPIILYSANPDAQNREAADGMDGTITMPVPFSAAQLLATVREVISEQQTTHDNHYVARNYQPAANNEQHATRDE